MMIFNLAESIHVCPKCGKTYAGLPALSKSDNRAICPKCAQREMLISIGIIDEQEHIVGLN